MHIYATETPTALPGLSVGTTYFLRNRGPQTVFVEVSATAPDADSANAFPVPRFGDFYPTPESGESVYVWTAGSRCLVAFVQAN